jgi:hypothetical protein
MIFLRNFYDKKTSEKMRFAEMNSKGLSKLRGYKKFERYFFAKFH